MQSFSPWGFYQGAFFRRKLWFFLDGFFPGGEFFKGAFWERCYRRFIIGLFPVGFLRGISGMAFSRGGFVPCFFVGMLYRAFSGRVLPTGFLGFFYREIISLFWIIFFQGTVSEMSSFLKGRLFGVFWEGFFPDGDFFNVASWVILVISGGLFFPGFFLRGLLRRWGFLRDPGPPIRTPRKRAPPEICGPEKENFLKTP